MAKDPAFLFYPSDFLIGTRKMSYEQKGKYIELLCIQFDNDGIISFEDMEDILDDNDSRILSKFVKTEDGYYNARLLEESNKRKAYSKSRSENRKKKTYDEHMKTYDEHMENININENTNKDINKIVIKNIKKEKHKYGIYKHVLLTDDEYQRLQNDFADYEIKIQNLDNYLENKNVSYKNHNLTIRQWANKDKEKQGVHKETFSEEVERRARALEKEYYGK